MTQTVGEIVDELFRCIKNKDAPAAVSKIQQYKECMRNTDIGSEFVTWISVPENLTKVHKALAEDLAVPPRVLAIRRAQMTRPQRAYLLIQAIELGIKKVYKLQ